MYGGGDSYDDSDWLGGLTISTDSICPVLYRKDRTCMDISVRFLPALLESRVEFEGKSNTYSQRFNHRMASCLLLDKPGSDVSQLLPPEDDPTCIMAEFPPVPKPVASDMVIIIF